MRQSTSNDPTLRALCRAPAFDHLNHALWVSAQGPGRLSGQPDSHFRVREEDISQLCVCALHETLLSQAFCETVPYHQLAKCDWVAPCKQRRCRPHERRRRRQDALPGLAQPSSLADNRGMACVSVLCAAILLVPVCLTPFDSFLFFCLAGNGWPLRPPQTPATGGATAAALGHCRAQVAILGYLTLEER